MNINYILPCLIKSKLNIINTKLNKVTPPQDVLYDKMKLKEATRDKLTKLWPVILKDAEKLSQLGNVLISYYPVTNKDKVLKEYFINNKRKILETYNEFDKLFNEILDNVSDYHETIAAARFMYKCVNYSSYYFKSY